MQGGFVVVGEGDLGLFNLMRQPVTGSVFDQGEQAGQSFRLKCVDVKPLLVSPNLTRVGEVNGVPGR